jgi:DNA-binding CsgD family transcriptional regulator/tetratricopeptide (TPR) repeat protein
MTASSRDGSDVPFVGREREKAVLDRCATAARRGEPAIVFIEGRAGAGKSSLLTRFLQGLPDACVIRGSGAESELPMSYGLIGQLLASAELGAREMPPASADQLVAGADLAAALCHANGADGLVVLAIDDLHWADPGSAAALLFALRRMHGEAFLGLLCVRPVEFGALGDGWNRFAAGDHRATRLRVGGLTIPEVQSLALATGVGELSYRAASRLVSHTGGSPGYCRAVLEEGSIESWDGPGDALPVPRQLASTVLASLGTLTRAARALADAAATIGRSSSLATAAVLAGLADPVPALDELAEAGLASVQACGSGNRILLSDALTHRVIYDEMGPIRRRQLHLHAAALTGIDAAALTGNDDALRHRIAAAAGPDATLAADLEAAGLRAAGLRGAGFAAGPDVISRGRLTEAATLLAHASALSPQPAESARLILDAVEILLRCGASAEAEAFAPRVAEAAHGSRRSAILGQLELLAARPASAEALLADAWQAHDPALEPQAGVQAAIGLLACGLVSGRLAEAVAWGERAVDAAGADPAHRQHALGELALALAYGQRGQEALARLDSGSACGAEIPLSQTDVLVASGMVRVILEDLEAAVTDLSAAAGRLRSGAPIRHGCLCLGYLAEAEYRLGRWDEASRHAEQAVATASQAGCAADFSFVHAFAALVPAGRGDWDAAAAHVDAAGQAARAAGSGLGIAAWAAARAGLAAARGDHEEVLRAASAVRRTGRARAFGNLGVHDWRPFEIDALIALGSLEDAGKALAEIDASLSRSSPASAWLSAARLRGALAAARGDSARSAQAFEHAWEHARGANRPFLLAQLELAEGRRLRQAARRPEAIARLRSARGRLARLDARPYISACDQELAACGVQPRPGASQTSGDRVVGDRAVGGQRTGGQGTGGQGSLGLTGSELAVARLVAAGRSNREAAAELYVSVKGIEFHLSNIFAKLGIRSRSALADCLGDDAGHPADSAPHPAPRSAQPWLLPQDR